MNKFSIIILLVAIAIGNSCKNKQNSSKIVNDSRTAQAEKSSDQTETTSKVIVQPEYLHEVKNTYRIKTYSIDGDILTIVVAYKNGCNDHFELYSNGMFLKSLPMQVNVFLKHNRGGEPCENAMEKTLKYDISALKAEGQAKVIVNLNGPDKKVEYVY